MVTLKVSKFLILSPFGYPINVSNLSWGSHSAVVGELHVDRCGGVVGDVVMLLLLLPPRSRSATATSGPPVGGVAVGGVVLLIKIMWLS